MGLINTVNLSKKVIPVTTEERYAQKGVNNGFVENIGIVRFIQNVINSGEKDYENIF